MSKYLYAFDLSLSCTGLAIFDIDSFDIVAIDSFKTNSKVTTGERLRAIEQEVLKYMKKFPPYEAVIERGFTQHNTATQQVFRVHGVINCRFWNVPQHEYTTSQWAKIITGYGKLDKDRVQSKLLLNMPDVKFRNDNESDAIGLGIAYLVEHYKMPWIVVGKPTGEVKPVKPVKKTRKKATK